MIRALGRAAEFEVTTAFSHLTYNARHQGVAVTIAKARAGRRQDLSIVSSTLVCQATHGQALPVLALREFRTAWRSGLRYRHLVTLPAVVIGFDPLSAHGHHLIPVHGKRNESVVTDGSRQVIPRDQHG